MPPTVEFFFDVVSPFTYLAATQIPEIAASTEATIHWRPFFLGGAMQATGNRPPASVPAKGKYLFKDLKRWAKRYDEPFRFPTRFPMNTLKAQRALTVIAMEQEFNLPTAAMALFRAHWTEDADLADLDVLRGCFESCYDSADDGAPWAAGVLARISEPEVKAQLRKTTDEAVERGVFGAPTFFVGDEMFFGNDRIDFLIEHIREISGQESIGAQDAQGDPS